MKKRFYFIFLFVILMLGGWFAARLLAGEKVMVVHPHIGTAIRAAYGTGTVEASVMMPIASRITARLVELKVDEGSQVVRGQLLARLEDEELQHSLKELKAREDYALNKYERSMRLHKKGNVSTNEYESDRSAWLAAKAAVDMIEAQISYLKLIAPADGTIIRRDGEVGQLIPANQAIFWLMCCAPLRITTEIDEEDIAHVAIGQPVLIQADAFPGRIFHGEVQEITPKGDPVSRSYRVRVKLIGKTPLMIGMTAETNIVFYENKKALLIPTTAVIDDKVWLIKNERLKSTPVKTGARGEEFTEITSGLTEADLVALHPKDNFENGSKVRPVLVKQGDT
ncbi:efflux RND transporter periplasmic adaptor subunit [Legionella spiritensis]|uniref:Membrane fusion protein n=1 Tax=Legionella spiritensis TaxID=452 RepID=A0A0W0ZAK7_LEGSP|nr:efflux RND transporter periplasmic adaptor subunit [Legionella spiritensis]KTD66136.1 membrane fusion protein [Legionella spiritensis]SNV43994.1 Membrane-fusion protein [Legionella spiritensis]